jgi:hypothetical protein
MPVTPGRRDPEVMNQAIGINQPARTYQRAPRLTGLASLSRGTQAGGRNSPG